ncbi:Rrf2 family transcriptional regulator [Variovorax humicola]|uniref:Rrf2 family transcriptional regulator n=1 Tax=Variovorax humicola TaxID=1769758 RepID=A0ABU8VZT6_9BURK
MRLTTKGRVAVSAMVDLASRRRGGPVSLATMSERQQVSVSYLEHLFGSLRRHGLVSATRGPGGGYTLGRGAAAISVADIVRAVESGGADSAGADSAGAGPQAETHAGAERSLETQRCLTPELWASLNRCIMEFLDGITLQSIAGEVARADMQAEVKAEAGRRRTPARRARPVEENHAMPVNSVFALGRAR